ncbi:hypothetical protein F2Q69_00025019 [Brassica cretica]|uniref:Reverse transcriptase zinc-binding domain-containing protein n=1 Tax=Brassica cretica TaxID=69181 RepID=A0A8S9QE61_BRACR|nr:hypothetical protein F2Q69_00025019 [Brassica cretica]
MDSLDASKASSGKGSSNKCKDDHDKEEEVLEPSITKLQAFAWKVNAPQKICHLIWQLISGQVAVTRNLVRRNMRCDNYFPRCDEPEETVTHAIFECPPTLQAWALSSTPSSSQTFSISSIYANMHYLFWRKNSIMVPEDDRDPYPWIIWYIWKAINDKLFRAIDRDPLELVRYAESECQACWIGWVWKDSMGKIQLMGTRNLRRCETALHSELEALRCAMESMLQHSTCQRFETDCKDLIAMITDPQAWPNFSTELDVIQIL